MTKEAKEANKTIEDETDDYKTEMVLMMNMT
jgi:hypothetical protein